MNELGDSLERMSFVQLLLLFAFVTSYVLTLGGLLSTIARRRSALLALALAVVFSALTEPWVHGALLMAFVVAGLGLFVMITWLLARLFGPRVPLEQDEPAADTLSSQPPALPQRLDTNLGPLTAPKLVRRARIGRS